MGSQRQRGEQPRDRTKANGSSCLQLKRRTARASRFARKIPGRMPYKAGRRWQAEIAGGPKTGSARARYLSLLPSSGGYVRCLTATTSGTRWLAIISSVVPGRKKGRTTRKVWHRGQAKNIEGLLRSISAMARTGGEVSPNQRRAAKTWLFSCRAIHVLLYKSHTRTYGALPSAVRQ